MDSGEERIDVRSVTGPHEDLVVRVAPAVCQILHCPSPGVEHPIGTGALVPIVAGVAILTAGHVLALGATGQLVARFNYERYVTGHITPVADWDLLVIEHWVDGLDYGLAMAVEKPDHPQPEDVFLPLEPGSSAGLAPGEPLFCLHHPNGEPKQMSAGTFVAFADSQLRYHVYTDARSSGAPLVNARGELVAVHRAELAPGRPCAKIGTAIDALRRTSPAFGG